MKAGFIGAGKVGFSLGKYLVLNGCEVSGYYSRNIADAKEAARFAYTEYFEDLAEIVDNSDTLFITVPDRAIGEVWDRMRNLPIRNKNICHCSGSISSAAFFDAENKGAFAYSVHPLLAVSDKYTSYKELSKAYFTIEGSEEHLEEMKKFFNSLGNNIIAIEAEKKALYHAAAVMVSNQTAALAEIGAKLLTQCGFNRFDAEKALMPLFIGNAERIAEVGAKEALTGPVERNDVLTVQKHLDVLGGDIRNIYISLSKELVALSEGKHPERNYEDMKKELENEKHCSNI